MGQGKRIDGLLRQAEQRRIQGNLKDAEAAYRKVLEQAPRNAAAYQGLSLLAHQVGKLKQAAELMAKAVELAPATAAFRRNLGEMLRRLGRLEQAVAQGRAATELAPENATGWYNLGIALDDSGDLPGARDAYRRAVKRDPRHNLAWNNLGSVLNRLGDEDAALAAYLKAAEIDSRHAEAQNNAAAIFIDRGELDEARTRLRLAIDAKPDFLEAHQNISTLTKYRADDPHYLYLEDQLCARNALSDEQRMRLLFAVGKAREDLKLYDLAFLAYREANRLKRATLHYDQDSAQRLCTALTDAFPPGSLPEPPADPDPTPVFIVGMPRSGTTLLEQVLCSHPRVHGAGELRDFHEVLSAHPKTGPMDQADQWVPTLTDADFLEIGAAYLERLRRHAPDAARITDKMPGNYHYLGLIRRALPGARIIHSLRDPMDSCLSNYTRLFNQTMEFAYDLEDLGHHYNNYVRCMRHWDQVIPADALLHLPYEAMVADLPVQARRIIAHIGLDWDDACLAFHENRRPVRTASVAQVREPIYQSSVARWRGYGEHLGPLRAIVGDDYPHGLG